MTSASAAATAITACPENIARVITTSSTKFRSTGAVNFGNLRRAHRGTSQNVLGAE